MKRKILRWVLGGIFSLMVVYLLVGIVKVTIGDFLFPNAQMKYTIRGNDDLEPSTELHVQITGGKGLLLKGRDVWTVDPDTDSFISRNATLYFYDIKKQAVFVRDYDENYEIIRREVSPDAIKGISLHKDGIVLTSKHEWVFAVTEIEDQKITFQNISDKLLTFQAIHEYR